MSNGAADRARLRHLDHCRQPRCFARDICEFTYFELPQEHPQGPAHGVRITVEKGIDTHLIKFFTKRPLLVEKDQGNTVLTLYCICPAPGLHEDFCCHLCAEFNHL